MMNRGYSNQMKSKFFLLMLAFSSPLSFNLMHATSTQNIQNELPIIKKILIKGARSIDEEAIKSRLPYQENRPMIPDLTKQAIQQIYSLGIFSQVSIELELLENNECNLIVNLEELSTVDNFIFQGVTHFEKAKLFEKLHLQENDQLTTEKVVNLVHELKRIYREANYLNVQVAADIKDDETDSSKKVAVFTIDEGVQVKIRAVNFYGTEQIPTHKLSTFIFTRPRWLLSATDDSGKIDEIMLEQDKHRIEFFYQDQGFLMAKVTGVDIAPVNDELRDVNFYIKEGSKFRFRYVSVECHDDEFDENVLKQYLSIEEGMLYSRTKIIDSINTLKDALGRFGYIFADVYPQVHPLEESKEVDIRFVIEKGSKLFVNNINIVGNKITRDKVIRRHISLEEGDLITSKKLNESKYNVEFLSYFERGSVNWKINKITETLADLDLSVHEARTGHLNFNMSYGADRNSANDSVKLGLDLGKSNILGMGFDASAIVQASPSSFQRGEFRIMDPYFLDSKVSLGFNAYVKRDEYQQWDYLQNQPLEKVWGIASQIGFALDFIDPKLQWFSELGIEHISYNNKNLVVEGINHDTLQPIVDLRFKEGYINWLSISLAKDTRNHRVYPNQGYRIEANSKFVFPFVNQTFSFYKLELEGSWYTPIIGPDSLVLMLHARGGLIHKFESDKSIPYKELFHMGGQGTVRGFLWGGVGPVWGPTGAPLGGKKALQFNAELIFPIVPDFSMKGHFFYDAGAGWDTVTDEIKDTSLIKRNKFNMRHSVGFGLNLMSPVPAKIDWGYKLDRHKKDGESASEFHLSMNYAW
jgi:outer membrane protein insertion porin family